MKPDDILFLMDATYCRRKKLYLKKMNDYAKGEVDGLSNFKVMAAINKTLNKHGYTIPLNASHGVAFWHLLHKYVRILNLWALNKEPLNESLEDSHIDLANFNDLASSCYMDYKKENLKGER